MKKSTEELLEQLRNTKNIRDFLDENRLDIPSLSLSKYLAGLLEEKNLKKADILKKSGIEKTYFYQLFRGDRQNPSRNVALMLALGAGLELTETRRLLKIAGCGDLYPKNERDCVIIYCILNGKSLIETNILLYDAGLEILE